MVKLDKLAFKKIEDFDRNKLTGHTYNCPWNNDPQYTHLWNDLDHLKSGKVARCGQPETHHCVHRVEYSIAGFRNTCPIAGRCGTYATPAPLRFSKFDFKGRGVKGKIELNNINFSFKHKNNGVDVANGKEAKTWGGKFSKVKIVLKRYDDNKIITLDSQMIEKGPSINQYRKISVNFNLDKLSKNIASQTQRKTFDNNRTLNLSQNDNFAIEIHYYRVENTNPSVIRLKDAEVDVEFTYLDKPSMTINKDTNIINCSSKKITHTIKVNSEEAFNNLNYKSIPIGFSKPSVSLNKNDYTKTYTWTYTKTLTDTKATIIYQTQANNFKTDEKITVTIYKNKIEKVINDLTNSKIVNKQISTIKNFVKGTDYNNKVHYVDFKNLKKSDSLCYDQINLHIKDAKREFVFPYYGDDKTYQCQSSEKQKVIGLNRCFYEQVINKLQCGEAKVNAEFIINGRSAKTISLPSIKVTSPSYSFIYEVTREHYQDDKLIIESIDDPQRIRQISDDEGDVEYNYYVTFTRSDDNTNYPAPTITSFYNETQSDIIFKDGKNEISTIITARKNNLLFYNEDEIRFKINIEKIGNFKIGFYYNDLCKTQHNVSYEFLIIPSHNQNYDYLYIDDKGSDYSYESIVIREGDNNRIPTAITNIHEINSYNNIEVCFNGDKTNISEMGLGNLTIKNKNDFAIKNLMVELSPLIKDEETGEYDWGNLWDTVFSDFANNLFAYNIGLKGRVEVIDNGEDVYLLFLEIPKKDEISIDIPFISKDEGKYYMALYINGMRLKRNQKNKFLPSLGACSKEDYAEFIITDTMLVELKINNYEDYINIDEHEYIYDNNCNLICNNNECNECGPFTVLYSIHNIDSITPISGEEYFIRIGHSPELKPIIDFDGAYEVDTKGAPVPYPLVYTNVQVIVAPKSEYENEEPITYTLKTNDNGEGVFYYTIPSTELRSYNTESLRSSEKFGLYYNGNTQNNPCSEGFSNKEPTLDENKFNTYFIIDDDFSQYHAGETVPIHFQLIYEKEPYDNGIYINLNEDPFKNDFKAGRTILIPVTYEGIKNNPNQVLETSIETISNTLTDNYISKKIYCNIDTQVKVNASLTKMLVQQNDSNTLIINVKNGLKPNQKVKIRVIANGYDIKNVNNITNGTYSITQDDNIKFYWNIGNMDSYENDQISIDLQAQNNVFGQQCIHIKAFDYLHEEGDDNE